MFKSHSVRGICHYEGKNKRWRGSEDIWGSSNQLRGDVCGFIIYWGSSECFSWSASLFQYFLLKIKQNNRISPESFSRPLVSSSSWSDFEWHLLRATRQLFIIVNIMRSTGLSSRRICWCCCQWGGGCPPRTEDRCRRGKPWSSPPLSGYRWDSQSKEIDLKILLKMMEQPPPDIINSQQNIGKSYFWVRSQNKSIYIILFDFFF